MKNQDKIPIYYNFVKLNKGVSLLGKLKPDIIGYLMQLIIKMSKENEIYLDKLEVSERTRAKVRKSLKDVGVIKKYNGKYYLNPYYAYNGRKITSLLYKLFEQENNYKIY